MYNILKSVTFLPNILKSVTFFPNLEADKRSSSLKGCLCTPFRYYVSKGSLVLNGFTTNQLWYLPLRCLLDARRGFSNEYFRHYPPSKQFFYKNYTSKVSREFKSGRIYFYVIRGKTPSSGLTVNLQVSMLRVSGPRDRIHFHCKFRGKKRVKYKHILGSVDGKIAVKSSLGNFVTSQEEVTKFYSRMAGGMHPLTSGCLGEGGGRIFSGL